MHSIFQERSPPYIKDLVAFSISGPQRRQLRSPAARSAVVPFQQQLSSVDVLFQYADQTFGIGRLPVNIRLTD